MWISRRMLRREPTLRQRIWTRRQKEGSWKEKQLSLPELEGKNLIDTYGINSLIALEIIIDIEKEFGIFIEDEEELIRAFSSIDDLAALVRKYKE